MLAAATAVIATGGMAAGRAGAAGTPRSGPAECVPVARAVCGTVRVPLVRARPEVPNVGHVAEQEPSGCVAAIQTGFVRDLRVPATSCLADIPPAPVRT